VSVRPALVAGLVLATAGCQSLPTATPLALDDTRASTLLAGLSSRNAERRALRGIARVSLDGPGGSSRSRQVLVAERPEKLRVEVHGFLNQVVAVLVSDGHRFELLRSGEREPERGVIRPELLYEVAGLPLLPEEVVSVLLGVPSVGTDALPGPAWALSDGGVRLDLRGDPEARRLEFDPDGNLRRLEVHAPSGQLLFVVRYDDYRPLTDAPDPDPQTRSAPFAHDIALDFPQAKARARVSFQQVELNPELPPGIFALLRSPGAQRQAPRQGGGPT
jgi:hypothetical protein